MRQRASLWPVRCAGPGAAAAVRPSLAAFGSVPLLGKASATQSCQIEIPLAIRKVATPITSIRCVNRRWRISRRIRRGTAQPPTTRASTIRYERGGNLLTYPLCNPRISAVFSGKQRRGWDSNPRYARTYTRFPSVRLKPLGHLSKGPSLYRRPPQASILSAARKADCGISTLPNCRIRFLPSFCFSSSFRLRVMSPP